MSPSPALRNPLRRAALAALPVALVAGCDTRSSGGSSASPPATSAAPQAVPGPADTAGAGGPAVPPTACHTAADCAPNGWCRFDEPGCGADAHGTCVGPEPLCTVAHPFCTCTGFTVNACVAPRVKWAHAGPCGDAARPPRPL